VIGAADDPHDPGAAGAADDDDNPHDTSAADAAPRGSR
jgi:hypothetical protein